MARVISAFGTTVREMKDWAGTASVGALKQSPPQALHRAEEQWLAADSFVVLQCHKICCVFLAPTLRDFGDLINVLFADMG